MDKSRQQFEETIAKIYSIPVKNLAEYRANNRYIDCMVWLNSSWEIWQASRESLEIELPKEQKAKAYDFYTDGYNSGIDCCEVRLESMGIKVIRNE
ncbi:MAG: hypothetical protein PV362_01110 [Providencia heimbachae]|nr:hypothetical protein [Providencia heimbachae]